MKRTAPSARRGFTLLEVLLASVIAIVVLGALYTAMDLMLRQMDAARRQTQMSDLSRSVIGKMQSDLTASLGPLQPKSGGGTSTTTPSTTTPTESGSQTGTTTAATPTTSTTGGTTAGTTTPTDTTTGIAGDSANPDAEGLVAADVPFQAGVVGTMDSVTLFVSRVPSSLADPMAAANPDALQPSDLRRVTYYLGVNGGLCRQERPWVTADGVRNSFEPDYSTEPNDMIAAEVVGLAFEYYDGGVWAGEWDGTMVSTDGKSVVGPPRAIRMVMTFEYPGRGGAPVQKRVEHVFPVRAAVGGYLPPVEDTTMMEDTSGTTGTTTTTPTGGM